MKKVMSVLLCAVVLISICVFSTSAALEPVAYGDADADGDENIFDVTFIQLCLVQSEEMDKLQLELSDVDDDGEITIMDATMIQHYLAGIISRYPAGYAVSLDMSIHNFYCNYGDANVTSEDMVTCYAEVYVDEDRTVTYRFYVNDVIMHESGDPSFTFGLPEPGKYKVTVVAESDIGVEKTASLYVNSIGTETHKEPQIGIYYTNLYKRELCPNAEEALINVVVLGGCEPYEYAFDLYDGEELIASQIMSEDNTFAVHPENLKIRHEYIMVIYVSTDDGNIHIRRVPVIVRPTKIG